MTISKFGALNAALVGLFRKILSVLLSLHLYHHYLTALQLVGLTLATVGLSINFCEKADDSSKPLTDSNSSVKFKDYETEETFLLGESDSLEGNA